MIGGPARSTDEEEDAKSQLSGASSVPKGRKVVDMELSSDMEVSSTTLTNMLKMTSGIGGETPEATTRSKGLHSGTS